MSVAINIMFKLCHHIYSFDPIRMLILMPIMMVMGVVKRKQLYAKTLNMIHRFEPGYRGQFLYLVVGEVNLLQVLKVHLR
jgi:hypothetical protein